MSQTQTNTLSALKQQLMKKVEKAQLYYVQDLYRKKIIVIYSDVDQTALAGVVRHSGGSRGGRRGRTPP